MIKMNEKGSGVAIYIFSMFLVMIIFLMCVLWVIVQQVMWRKERAQVILHHALNDAVRVAQPIIETDGNGTSIVIKIPEDQAKQSFCDSSLDGISFPKLAGMHETGSECVGVKLTPASDDNPFSEGMRVEEFKVINDGTMTVNGREMQAPLVYAKISFDMKYTINGKTYLATSEVEAAQRPAVYNTVDQQFLIREDW